MQYMISHYGNFAPALLAWLLLMTTVPAEATVYGSCEAWYRIRTDTPGDEEVRTETFYATGLHASEPLAARRDARARLETCVRDHWADPHRDSAPASCYGGRPGAPGIDSYPFTNLLAGISRMACTANPGRERLFVDIVVVVDGDEGCISARDGWAIDPFPTWVRLECATPARIKPIPRLQRGDAAREPARIRPQPRLERTRPPLPGIRLPGNDLRRSDTASWAACRDLCDADSDCRAWTWRAPGTSGPGSAATCLLKSAAGLRVPDSCCHSGIKE